MNNSVILNSTLPKLVVHLCCAQNSVKDINLICTLIQGNNAPVGQCGLRWIMKLICDTKAIINMSNSSVVKNGSSSSLSTIDLCGNPEDKALQRIPLQKISQPANGGIIRSVSEVESSFKSLRIHLPLLVIP